MTRTLVVTGASAGIGAACARLAPSKGWQRVVVHYGRDLVGAEAVAAQIMAQGAEARVMQADVTDMAAVAALFAGIGSMSPGLFLRPAPWRILPRSVFERFSKSMCSAPSRLSGRRLP